MKRRSHLLSILAMVSLQAGACSRSEPEHASSPAAISAAPPSTSVAPPTSAPSAAPPAAGPGSEPAAPSPPSTAFPKTLRPGESTFDPEAALREIIAADRQLGDAMALSTPDCSTAHTLRDRICELATRLCLLASPHPDLDLRAKCSDGKSRCESARAKVDARCP